MARKVFEYEPVVAGEVPEFEIRGEVFYCQPTEDVSSLDVLDYVAGMTGESGVVRIQTMLKLFKTFIPAGDVERFRKTVKDNRVPLPTLAEIASWTLNEYLAFPTREGNSSSTGSPDVSPPNADGSSPPPDAT